MTKREAITKISKLERLAAKAGSPQEASNARRAVEDLKKKHGITDRELQIVGKADAFDDLVGRLDAYARSQTRQSLPASVFEVLGTIKSKTAEDDKAKALDNLVGVVRVGAFLFGTAGMGPIKEIVEETLKRHSLTI
jgi:hypothetical protein